MITFSSCSRWLALKLSWKSHQMTPFFFEKRGIGYQGISIDANSGNLGYVIWCCGSICHRLFTFIQIGSGHTVNVFTQIMMFSLKKLTTWEWKNQSERKKEPQIPRPLLLLNWTFHIHRMFTYTNNAWDVKRINGGYKNFLRKKSSRKKDTPTLN